MRTQKPRNASRIFAFGFTILQIMVVDGDCTRNNLYKGFDAS